MADEKKSEKYETIEILSPVFSGEQQVRDIASKFGTPVYVYSQRRLEEQAEKALNFPNAYGLTVRYAMKSNPNANILRIFNNRGIHIDASSEHEVERAIRAGISPERIMLTAQKIPDNLQRTLNGGVLFNACSTYQLESYGLCFPGSNVSIRVNPGLGSGGTNRTNTGGEGSSFGIWHEQLSEALNIADKYDLNIQRVHTHIGSGSDPEVWKKVALMSLGIVERCLEEGNCVETLNLGGGYKVGRMSYEKSTDLFECGTPVAEAFREFAIKSGKRLKLEIEPGTFLVANAGAVVASVVDMKSTPGYNFIITDSGMTEVTRPSLYGAQHPITVVPFETIEEANDYIVSGKCCESGDILTPMPGDSEGLRTRRLTKAEIDDQVVIGGAGAYCAGMNTKNYNSYPEAPEVLIDKLNEPHLIRKKQTLDQIIQNEIQVVNLIE
jgi:diaminopimelate decarboxylase